LTVDLPMPRVGPLSEHAPAPLKIVLNWGRRYSLWVFNFGLACCAIEFIAASMARHDFIRLGVIPFAPGPRQADLMVVSGTVTDKMAPAVRRLYDQMPEPKYVISFGACSNSGGPYWDSYCVMKGVDTIIPVDVYVPGCPPRPEALLQGIIKLQEKIAAESLSGKAIGRRYAGGRLASAAEVTRPLVAPGGHDIPGRGDPLQPRAGEKRCATKDSAPPSELTPVAPGTPPAELPATVATPAVEGPPAAAPEATQVMPTPQADPAKRASTARPTAGRPAQPRRRARDASGEETLADDIFGLGDDER